jgi:hypothetical protein
MNAVIPDGATLANHRADGHGGATHDVIRDGMIIGVHTSQRRNQCGIITPAQYHPHEKPIPVRARPLETYYTEDPPDDWTPPARYGGKRRLANGPAHWCGRRATLALRGRRRSYLPR